MSMRSPRKPGRKSLFIIIPLVLLVGLGVPLVLLSKQVSPHQPSEFLLQSPEFHHHQQSPNNTNEKVTSLQTLQEAPKYKNQESPVLEQHDVATNNTLSVFDTYDPFRFPVFDNFSANRKIKVGYATIRGEGGKLSGEAKHFLWDGITGSDYLELVGLVYLDDKNQTMNPNDADVWLVNGHRTHDPLPPDAPFLQRLLTLDSNTTWKVLITSFSDRYGQMLKYQSKFKISNRQSHIRVAIRSIVVERDYNDTVSRVMPGYVAQNVPAGGGPTLHMSYAVRLDTVQTLQTIVLGNSSTDNGNYLQVFQSKLAAMPRPIDIIHLWQPVHMKHHLRLSRLRNAVSYLVNSWNGKSIRIHNQNYTLKTSTDEKGARRMAGRQGVDPKYVRALSSSKIVIVAQKDRWEGMSCIVECQEGALEGERPQVCS